MTRIKWGASPASNGMVIWSEISRKQAEKELSERVVNHTEELAKLVCGSYRGMVTLSYRSDETGTVAEYTCAVCDTEEPA